MNKANKNLRILIVDDNRAIHADFRKILCHREETSAASWEAAARELLGEESPKDETATYELDSAYQGKEALEMVRQALREGRPYAMAFVDVRMPPGWDGVETTAHLWEACPDLQVVICTAYSDYSWEDMSAKLHCADRLLLLKKPFDSVEALQLASALTEKWQLQQRAQMKVEELEALVQERTRVLLETNQTLHEEVVERQRVAEALRESEERYQLLFSKNPLPMWVYDAQTLNFLAVNETAVREYGYTTGEFLAMSTKNIRASEEAASSSQSYDTTFETSVNSYVTRHRKKSGSCIDVEIISRRIFYAGRCANLVLANDITQRKAAEDRIHEQATLLDLAHDAIHVRDLTGRIQFWNKGAERLYGWTSDEVMGRKLEQFFPADFTGASRAAEKILLETGEWSGELRKHNRKGQELTVNSRWTLSGVAIPAGAADGGHRHAGDGHGA
jgi:two-component system cell cycle sensor histidine kinase/response regulator CckA